MVRKTTAMFRETVKALLMILLVGLFGCSSRQLSQTDTNLAFHRILKTRTIRCSYLLYTPYFNKEPNTGKLSGIFYDIMEQIGKNAGLKIDWVEQVGYAGVFPELDSNRSDVFAGGLWPNATRAQVGLFTIPVFYSVVTAWGRPEDKRFLKNLDAVNSPNIRIATMDGSMEDVIAKSDFPRATRVSIPELTPFSQNLVNITSGKADITFAEPGVIAEYLKTNPGKLKEFMPNHPVRIFGNSLAVKLGEIDLKEFLDVALREVLYSGEVDRILKKYEPVPNAFRRVALPYQSSKS